MSKSTPQIYIIAFLIPLLFLSVSAGNTTTDVSNTESGVDNSSLIVTHSTSSFTGDTPPSSGDWIVTSASTCIGETVYVNGSIIVQSGGTLTITNSNIYFNLEGETLEVQAGGTLIIDTSTIIGTAPGINSYSIDFHTTGSAVNVNIDDSTIQDFSNGYIAIANGLVEFNNVNFRNWTDTAIDINYGDVNVIDCDFYDPDGSGSTYYSGGSIASTALIYIDTSVGDSTIIDGCTFRNLYYPDNGGDHCTIFQRSSSFGYVSITNNEFSDIHDADGGDAHSNILWLESDNVTIDSNHFHNNWGKPISISGDNITISNNVFESHHDYDVFIGAGVGYDDSYLFESPCAIVMIGFATEVLIEKNRIFNWPGSGIVAAHTSFNNTIRDNLMQDVADAGVYFIQGAHNYTVTGNLIASSNIGLDVGPENQNLTIYKNAFVNETIYAVDRNSTARGISWDNGTYGNLWTNYVGLNSNNDWVGDSAHVMSTYNVTDSYPALMIGNFAPSFGTWTIDTPHMFYTKDAGDIYASILVDGVAGVLGLMYSDMNIQSGLSITLNDESTLFLIEASIQVRTLIGTYTFNVNDMFNWFTWNSTISNVTSSLTIETRFFRSLGCTFHEIPGMEVTMYAYHDRTHQGAIPVYIRDNTFRNVTGHVRIHRELEFTNNSISFEVPASAHWVQLTEWDESSNLEPCLVEENTITGGRLNVSTGYSTCNVTDNYAELGMLIDVDGLSNSYFNISGNTANQNELNIYVQVEGLASSAYVEMRNNTLNSGTLTIWCNGGQHAGFDMSYTTHNSGTTNIDNAIYGTIDYFNHASGTTNIVNVYDVAMDHCTLGGNLYVNGSDLFKFLNGYVGGTTDIRYSGGSHLNSTDFNDGSISIYNSDDAIIAHNNFSGFSREFSYSDGQIRIFGSDYCTIYDNNFLNSNDSIDMRFSDFTVIEKNYIELVDGYGIYLEGTSYNLTVRDNVFNGGTYGLTESLSENNHNMTIINNVFANMTGNAIYTRYSSNLIISFNTIYNVSGHGVYTDHGSNHRIHGNTIWNVSATGITTYGNNISLAHNIIYDCGTDGVYLSHVAYYAIIHNNTITHCGSDGLYSSNGGYYQATIFNNTIAFNGGWGYYAGDLVDSLLYTNYFYGNGDGSLYIRWGSNNQLDNGTVGNFYEEYRGVESGTPWIGATPWYARDVNTAIVGTDNHPIMGMGDLTPATGDWIVDELTIILGVARSIDGDIIITSTGNLTLVGTQITFTTGGVYWSVIEVQSNGALRMIEGAKFTSDQTTATYGLGLRSEASLHLDNATIDRCGYPSFGDNPGFHINITAVYVNNVTASNSYFGLKFVYADGVIVSDTYFYNTDFGLWLFHCDDVLIEGLTFDTVLYGVYAENSHRATINDCDFSDVTNRGIWMASCDNWVIFNNRFISVPTAIHLNSLCDNAEIYFNFFSGMTTYLDDSGVGTALTNGTYGNMYLEYPGYDYNGDLIGDTPYTFGSNTDSLPLMVWGSWPSTNPGWHVTVDTWCLATNFTLNGDVTIYSGATFRVYSATLWFNCSSDLEYGFFINDGGAIYYYNGGLRAYDVTNQFDVHAYPNSSIHFDGVLLNGSYRILIDTNATYLNDLELHNAYDGICLQGSGNNLHGVTVTDCDFTDVENRGIHVGYCTGTTIIGCVFTNIGNRGIDLWYSADSVIADCTFAGVNDGVYMVLSTNTLLDNLSFAAVADDAIYAFACTDITMKNLQVTDADTGIYIQANIYGELTVFDSVFDDVQYGIRFNVWTSDDATLIVDNLTVSNIGQYGIEAQYLGNVTIIDSEFNVHGGVMIRVYYSVDWFYIEGCQGFNGSTGIYVYTGASGLIENCNFLNFTLGVDANGADVNITDSYFFGCTTGITANSALMNIIHNDFEHSETGVSTGTITNLVFANNTLTYMNNGFFSGGSIANVTLYGNTYSFFTYDAIGMTLGTSGGSIYNETINGCRYGILFQYAENVTIDLVTIINAERGLFLQWAVNPYITNVDISTCDVGIYIHDSASSTFRDCTITNTPEGIYFYIPSAEKGNHDFDSSNLYEGKPIYHFFDEIGTSHSGLDTYHLSISFCSFMTISESSIAGDRIYLVGLDNLTLANSTIGASFLIRDSHDMSINGNDFTSTEQITFSYEVTITNVTFTLNSFLTNYQFASSGFNLNASDYGNYWYNYPHDTDDNHDGIGDIPWVVNSMTDYLPLISPPYGYDVSTAILSPADAAHVGGSADVDIETILILGVYYVGSPSTSVSADVNGTEIWTGAIGAQSFSFDSTAFADGFYLLTITTLVDGSDAFTASIEFYIDNTAPVIYGMVPDNQYATSSSGLNPYGYFTDALSSIAWGAVYVDGSLEYNETSTMYSFALSFVDERGYNVTVVVMDTAGNIATGTLFYYYDATAPIISEPADLEYPLGSTGNVVTWTVTDLTGSHYNITLNGVSVFNGTLDSDTVEYNVDGLPIGSYSLQIRAYDRAGWESYDIVYVTVTESTTTTTTTTTITETTTTTTTTTGLPPPPPDGILIIVLAIGGIAAVAIVVVVLIMMRRKAAA